MLGAVRSSGFATAALVVGLAAPGTALADGGTLTTPTTPSTTTAPSTAPATPTPTSAPGPVKASVRLLLPDSFSVSGHPVTVPRRVIHVTGVVSPYVAGQSVKVRILLGRRVVKSALVPIRRLPEGRKGHFSEAFRSPAAGGLAVEVAHRRTPQMLGFLAIRRLAALDEHVRFGSTGRFVQLIQQRLAALHFYIPQSGVYDQGTGLALDAYHRLLRRGTSQTLDGVTISYLLNGWGEFRVRFPHHGRHAEGNLSLQLIALADGSKVKEIFPISSGKPSTPTILGDFRIYSRVPGYLPDGMYYSDFFIRGYAIHGYNPAPDYPASHGCMRLPIVDAIPAYNWLALGDWVDVYY
jgi:hypothetical protein